MPLAPRLAWGLALAGAAVLFLYASLSAGPDRRVAAFRVVTLLAACLLPLLAARLVPAGHARPFGGAVLAGTFAAGLVHRALARWRRESAASRLLEGARWLLELAGIVLLAAAAVAYAREGRVLGPAALWGLLCLRLSIADLLDPSRLAKETGLTTSAAKDLKAARRGRTPVLRRGTRLFSGLVKSALAVLWVFLPLLASVAPGEVARGEWPKPALVLALYPAGSSLPHGRPPPHGRGAAPRVEPVRGRARRGRRRRDAALAVARLQPDLRGRDDRGAAGPVRRRDARGLPLRRGRARALNVPT